MIDEKINKTIFRNKYWRIQKNAVAGKRGCKVMLMITPLNHWRHITDIPPDAWEPFGEMLTWACKEFDIPGGALFLRFGPMDHNTGTMPHLHWNIWVPDKSARGKKRKVWIPIQKTKAEEYADRRRTKRYSIRYENGEVPDEI